MKLNNYTYLLELVDSFVVLWIRTKTSHVTLTRLFRCPSQTRTATQPPTPELLSYCSRVSRLNSIVRVSYGPYVTIRYYPVPALSGTSLHHTRTQMVEARAHLTRDEITCRTINCCMLALDGWDRDTTYRCLQVMFRHSSQNNWLAARSKCAAESECIQNRNKRWEHTLA